MLCVQLAALAAGQIKQLEADVQALTVQLSEVSVQAHANQHMQQYQANLLLVVPATTVEVEE